VAVRYRRADGAVSRHAHGKVYVLPPGSTDMVVLSGTGIDVWQGFSMPKTIGEVVADLVGRYDVPAQRRRRQGHAWETQERQRLAFPSVVERDVTSAVADLVERRVLAKA
jgi:hypothetical protein